VSFGERDRSMTAAADMAATVYGILGDEVKMKRPRIKLPPCGIFVGSGVYPSAKDYLLSAMHGHMAWQPQTNSPLEMIEKIIDDNQGNLAQFWGVPRGSSPAVAAEWLYALDEIGIKIPDPDWENGKYLMVSKCKEIQQHADRLGAGALRFAREAAKKGVYTAFIYVDARPQWSRQFKDLGEYYLGYDYGEDFSFRPDTTGIEDEDLSKVTLKSLADAFIAKVRKHVSARHADGWGNVMATSGNFCFDYEVLGGADIPVVEDFAFKHLGIASALSRGLYRQHDLPMWGSHLAHEHYSWIPYSNPHKFDLLRAAMYQKYMSGSKMIINESGNWFVEATLCEDSPKFEFPRVPLKPSDVSWHADKDPMLFAPYIKEARKHYHKIDYNAPIPRRYRKEISDFYDFVKEHGTPKGQPESTVAIIKGNYDLSSQSYDNPNSVIGGARKLAAANPRWRPGPPEYGWEIVKRVFYPLLPILGKHHNHFLSGSPFGMVDIVSFAKDQITAETLSANYKALLFAAWNTCSNKQYEVLLRFVNDGGTLFVSIPHLSTNITRNYCDFSVSELINGGDVSDLCGVKIKGRGGHFFWATAPHGSDALGFTFPRRFGVIGAHMGDVDITDPAAETLIVDDEQAYPILLRRRCGKGTVYFMNTWAYPGAVNMDEGPGSTIDSPGMVGTIYRHIAAENRGFVWITDDGKTVGSECEYITYSYFPASGQICLLNVDFDHPHGFVLHHGDTHERIDLAPGEFRMMNAGTPAASSQNAAQVVRLVQTSKEGAV